MATSRSHDAITGGAQTLHRGIRILELLAEARYGLTVNGLATELGVHRAVIYRLVGTLTAHRLTVRGDDGRVRLWTGIIALSRGVFAELQSIALPELERLAEEVGHTAILTVADGTEAVDIAVVEPRHTPVHIASRPGQRHPLDRGASGKAILMAAAPRPGEHTEVTKARRRGYAVSQGEVNEGVYGIAAPIRAGSESTEASVAIVAIARPGKEVADEVVTTANRISGYVTNERHEVD